MTITGKWLHICSKKFLIDLNIMLYDSYKEDRADFVVRHLMINKKYFPFNLMELAATEPDLLSMQCVSEGNFLVTLSAHYTH